MNGLSSGNSLPPTMDNVHSELITVPAESVDEDSTATEYDAADLDQDTNVPKNSPPSPLSPLSGEDTDDSPPHARHIVQIGSYPLLPVAECEGKTAIVPRHLFFTTHDIEENYEFFTGKSHAVVAVPLKALVRKLKYGISVQATKDLKRFQEKGTLKRKNENPPEGASMRVKYTTNTQYMEMTDVSE